MEKPIAIVQHEKSVPGGLVTEVLDRRGVDHVIVESWTDTDWPEARDLAALVVMGGTMNVDQLDDYPFLKLSRQLMTDAISEEVPVLGVCLGSQMLARVLGAEVGRCDPRNVSFAPLDISTEGLEDPLVANFESVPVLQFHEDTFDLPTGAVPLAKSSSNRTHQAFRYGDSAYGIQFHFEVDAAIVAGWCRDIGAEKMRTEWGVHPEDFLTDSAKLFDKQRAAGARLVEEFLVRSVRS